MRIYGIANLIFFVLEFTFMLLTQFRFTGKSVFYVHDESLPVIPIYVDPVFQNFGWVITLVLQGLFVLRGLPWATFCIKSTTHFTNCLILKIKFSFALLCCLMALSVLLFSLLSKSFALYTLIEATILFIILKCKSSLAYLIAINL